VNDNPKLATEVVIRALALSVHASISRSPDHQMLHAFLARQNFDVHLPVDTLSLISVYLTTSTMLDLR
jgi:hypothetical protein